MNITGIGPLLAIVGGCTVIIISAVQRLIGLDFSLSSPLEEILFVLGIVLIFIGMIFWISSVFLVKKAFESHKLITTGVYRFSRNPLYAAFIVFIIPGISFLTNNLLLLAVSIMMYIAFKMRIGKEEEFLAKEFGEDYEQYKKQVAQLIPFVR